jgi:hypothetical protein
MAFGCLFQFFSLVSSASIVAEYRFGSNFGQVFYDYSGNGHHAVNGLASTSTSQDTIATDRGAYFSSSGSQILLPPNDKVSSPFFLSTPFSITMWVLPTCSNDCYLFTREVSGITPYIYAVYRLSSTCNIWIDSSDSNLGSSGAITNSDV